MFYLSCYKRNFRKLFACYGRFLIPKIEWDIVYSYAKQYYEENGHLFVPKKYETHDGFTLGKWIWEQRHNEETFCYREKL
ncbi:MAG: helicase associated domain-containing protein [Lachnospiraceae bacterium]|nr:helicase associated domain-containing protein [Lachnospiraceae bacterium]